VACLGFCEGGEGRAPKGEVRGTGGSVESRVWRRGVPSQRGRVWAWCCAPPRISFNFWLKMGHFCSIFGVQARGHPSAPSKYATVRDPSSGFVANYAARFKFFSGGAFTPKNWRSNPDGLPTGSAQSLLRSLGLTSFEQTSVRITHLTSPQPTSRHLNRVCCEWSQPRRTGSL